LTLLDTNVAIHYLGGKDKTVPPGTSAITEDHGNQDFHLASPPAIYLYVSTSFRTARDLERRVGVY